MGAALRVAFFGSPAFAVPALEALARAGHDIAAVYCQPPRPANRGQSLTRCAVHAAADAMHLPVRTPARLRQSPEEQESFAALGLDIAVVAAYGQILPQAMLDAPRRGCLNIHASLLPRWRGAAPIHRAILAGDAESGVTIMRMEAGLDTGPMLLREATPIGPRTTTPALHDALSAIGARLVLRAIDENPPAVPQPTEGITYAAKIVRADGKLDFARTAAELDRQVRAMLPWPGCTATLGGDIIKILAAEPAGGSGDPGSILGEDFTVACGEGALRFLRVQRAGRPPTDASAFLRGIKGARELTLT